MVHRILFLHGAGPQPAANPLLQAVRRQWPDADLIAPALPGPEDPDPDLWQEAIGRVIRAIPDEPWVIVGHSLGGSEALRFLCHRIPTLLQRVVTVASPRGTPRTRGGASPDSPCRPRRAGPSRTWRSWWSTPRTTTSSRPSTPAGSASACRRRTW